MSFFSKIQKTVRSAVTTATAGTPLAGAAKILTQASISNPASLIKAAQVGYSLATNPGGLSAIGAQIVDAKKAQLQSGNISGFLGTAKEPPKVTPSAALKPLPDKAPPGLTAAKPSKPPGVIYSKEQWGQYAALPASFGGLF